MTPQELIRFIGINEGFIKGIICPRCGLMSEEEFCYSSGWCWNCADWTTDMKKKEAV